MNYPLVKMRSQEQLFTPDLPLFTTVMQMDLRAIALFSSTKVPVNGNSFSN
ncbi:hypothetical protein [Merismopedia glauca]|uniref:hypothetical protein n=1 Tax=Merismopedia glauca TaxID=292586 RepID=UPI0015E7C7E3|nr:hypothetical protein [Merismopedia glauca]